MKMRLSENPLADFPEAARGFHILYFTFCVTHFVSSHHQSLDIADDADGGSVFAGDVVARLFEDIDDLGAQQLLAGSGADIIETDIAEPVAEEQSGVTTVVDKHRAIRLTVLRFDDQQEIIVWVL